MGVFDVAIPGGSESNAIKAIGVNIGDIFDAVSDINDDLQGIAKGIDDIQDGMEKIEAGAALAFSGPVGANPFSIITNFALGMVIMGTGMVEAAWGVLQVVYWGAQLIWDITRLVVNILQIVSIAFVATLKMTVSAIIALVKSGPSESIMSIVDPMRWGRSFFADVLGVEKFVITNDYVRVPLRGKGIVRETLTIPLIGQVAVVKLNAGHAYVTVPSSELMVLGHVYNSIKF